MPNKSINKHELELAKTKLNKRNQIVNEYKLPCNICHNAQSKNIQEGICNN